MAAAMVVRFVLQPASTKRRRVAVTIANIRKEFRQRKRVISTVHFLMIRVGERARWDGSGRRGWGTPEPYFFRIRSGFERPLLLHLAARGFRITTNAHLFAPARQI